MPSAYKVRGVSYVRPFICNDECFRKLHEKNTMLGGLVVVPYKDGARLACWACAVDDGTQKHHYSFVRGDGGCMGDPDCCDDTSDDDDETYEPDTTDNESDTKSQHDEPDVCDDETEPSDGGESGDGEPDDSGIDDDESEDEDYEPDDANSNNTDDETEVIDRAVKRSRITRSGVFVVTKFAGVPDRRRRRK